MYYFSQLTILTWSYVDRFTHCKLASFVSADKAKLCDACTRHCPESACHHTIAYLTLCTVTDVFGRNRIKWTSPPFTYSLPYPTCSSIGHYSLQLFFLTSNTCSPLKLHPLLFPQSITFFSHTDWLGVLTSKVCMCVQSSCDNDICPSPLWVLLPHGLLLAQTQAAHDILSASTLTWNAASEGSLVSLLRLVARGQSCSAKRLFKFKSKKGQAKAGQRWTTWCILTGAHSHTFLPVHPRWLLPAASQCGDVWTEPWWLPLEGTSPYLLP